MGVERVSPPVLHRKFYPLEEEAVHGVRQEVVEAGPEDGPGA